VIESYKHPRVVYSINYITVKRKPLFNQALVTLVASQCLPCGNQSMCTQVQPTLILLAAVEKEYSRR